MVVFDLLGAQGWWQHDTKIERKKGESGYEDEFFPAAPTKGFYDGGVRLVRGPNGDQITAAATAYYPPGTEFVPVGSWVTAPTQQGGLRRRVALCINHEVGAMPVPAHVEVLLE